MDASPAVIAPRMRQSPYLPTGAPTARYAIPRGHSAGTQPLVPPMTLVVRKFTWPSKFVSLKNADAAATPGPEREYESDGYSRALLM